MDPAVIILAMASVPILAHNIYWLHREGKVDTYYGIFSGIYTAAGAVGVAYGYPGNLIMPVSFAIIGLGGLHAFMVEKKRGKIIKAALFLALGAGIYLAGVFL